LNVSSAAHLAQISSSVLAKSIVGGRWLAMIRLLIADGIMLPGAINTQ
jgi:hypothetical protein